jgi:hypothetical protein
VQLALSQDHSFLDPSAITPADHYGPTTYSRFLSWALALATPVLRPSLV